MGIGKFIWRIYVMDMPDVAMLMLIATVVFCLAERKLERFKLWRWLCCCALAVVIGAIVYTTIGQRAGSGDYRVYLTPFHSYREVAAGGSREIYRSNFMNVMLFYPAGLLALSLQRKGRYGWLRLMVTVIIFATFSGGIEYVQYRFRMGHCEIDDVLHNALGALLGGCAGLLLPPLICRGMAAFSETQEDEI